MIRARMRREGNPAGPALRTPDVVAVVGMHRSGTSAIARSLVALGIDLGDRLMPAMPEVNAKGFWEDLDINAFNMEALAAIESDWHRLQPLREADWERLREQGFMLRAAELLRAKRRPGRTFGFKDPRLGKLLPLWQEVFDTCQLTSGYVVAIRNPLSVARSLERRDGFAPEKSYLLWLEHTLAALNGSRGHARVLLDYDALMRDPGGQLERVGRALGCATDPNAVRDLAREFLDDELRHSIYSSLELELDDDCPKLIAEVYRTLVDMPSEAAALDTPEFEALLRRWSDQFSLCSAFARFADHLIAQSARQEIEISGRDGHIAGLQHMIEQKDGHNASLMVAVRDRDAQLAQLHGAVRERDTQILGLKEAATERERLTVLLREAADRAATRGEQDGAALLEAQQGISRLMAQAARAERQAQRLSAGLRRGVAERTRLVTQLEASIGERQRAQVALHDVNEKLVATAADLARSESEAAQLRQSVRALEQRLASVVSHWTWRLTALLRRPGS